MKKIKYLISCFVVSILATSIFAQSFNLLEGVKVKKNMGK